LVGNDEKCCVVEGGEKRVIGDPFEECFIGYPIEIGYCGGGLKCCAKGQP
jgi:hypothetical protein